MNNYLKLSGLVIVLMFAIAPAMANHHGKMGNWTLSASESKVSFGSIKKGKAGEVHHFQKLSGTASDDGSVSVAIDVSSIETWTDIRNERMLKWVFDAVFPKAMLATRIDPKYLTLLKPGETRTISIKGRLTLNGSSIPIATDLFVARLSANKVMVTTDEMIMLSTEKAGIDSGISKLKEIAKLADITRVVPVSLRFVFQK